MRRHTTTAGLLLAALAITSVGVTRVSAQNNRIDVIAPLAPELAEFGPHAIGVRTIQAVDPNRADVIRTSEGGPTVRADRRFTLEVWYPAGLSAGQQAGTDYRAVTREPSVTATLHGRAVRDAAPLATAGPFPLVVLSHGYPGNRYLMSHLGENLASKGYVVVSIDHPESTYDDQQAFASTLYNRPFDQLFVVNEIARLAAAGSGSFLAGRVDASRTGIVGYSMGGYGLVNVIGGGYRSAAASFQNAPPNRMLLERSAEHPGYQASRDGRIKAAVAVGPWGMQAGYWDAAGLAGIRTPTLFVAGSHDDVSSYERGTRALFMGAVNATRALLTFVNANHNAAAPIPAPAETYAYSASMRGFPFTHYADPVWDSVRMNNIFAHFVTAHFDAYLKDDRAKLTYFDVVPNGGDAVYAIDRDGRPLPTHTYWKGFKRGTAGGLLLERGMPAAAPPAAGRRGDAPGPWFNVPLPPTRGAVPAVVVGDRGTRSATVPPGEAGYRELEGRAIRADLDTIIGFATESRTTREIGSGQLWGRVTGFPSSLKTVNWAAEQFRNAGIKDVRLQALTQDPQAKMWLPLQWEFKLLGDPAYGAGSTDLVLESATPLGPDLPGGTLTAPLVFVGSGNAAVTQHLDVKGKIAVQLVVPQAHMVFERGAVSPHVRDLANRGAVAVVNLMRQPGNEFARDLGGCPVPCFNIGGRDGFFLERVLDRAAIAGRGDVRAQLTLRSETKTGLTGANAVAVIPGASDQVIVLDAHVDACYDGAGDNGDGLAVLVALARHFAKPEHGPRRTLALVASAGHHTPGLNGPRGFLAANPELARRAVLVVNIEHVAQRNFAPGRSVAADGYRDFVADAGEAPITAGITNESPYLDSLFQQGVARYGTNFVSAKSAMASGESGGFASVNGAVVTIMQAPPLYHTSGETREIISTPGLERMARFLAYFVKQAGAANATDINPPNRPPRRAVDADDR